MKRIWTVGVLAGLLAAAPALAQDQQAGHPQPPKAGAAKTPKAQLVEITVTADGFVPALTRVKAGQPVTLVVTRKVERTCATDIVIKDFGIKKPLPLNEPVEVTFTPEKPGKVRFACAMDMIAGEISVE